MELTDLITQLVEKMDLEEDKELFLEAINELGEEVSVDDILNLYEGIGNANNELDSSSAKKAEVASGLTKGAEGSVDPLHGKMNAAPKEKQDGSKITGIKQAKEDGATDDKLDTHHSKLNAAAKAKVGALKPNDKALPESLDITDDISAIFEGTDLTEDFKEKAQLIFETAIKVKLDEHMEQIEESVADIINEEIEAYKEEVSEQLEKYLEYVVEEFIEQNEVALTAGLKVEIAESMFEGFKNLLAEHNVDVSDEKVDLVDEVISENEEIVESYNKEVEKNIALVEELRELRKEKLIVELTEGLTAIEADRFAKLVEGIDYKDDESFVNKVSVLVDAYSSETSSKNTLNENISYQEEVQEQVDISSDVKRVLSSLQKFGK